MSSFGLLDDYAELDDFSVEVKRNKRTVRRWLNEPDGLPYTKLGNRILIHIPTAKAWIAGRMRKPNPPRRNYEDRLREAKTKREAKAKAAEVA